MKHGRRAFLSNPWLVTATSAALVALLVWLLVWDPWAGQAITAAAPLRMYCAANVTGPMQQIVHDFRQEYGVEVQPTFDGSGKLLATIAVTRGQGDLFLAADTTTMEKAKKDGWIAETIPVAVLTPVLAVRPEVRKALQAEGRDLKGVGDLMRGDLKVVLANPDLASIGLVTREVLESRGQWQELERAMRDPAARVSTVGTVLEVAGAIQHGHRTIGIVWDAVADQFGFDKVPLPEFSDRVEHMWIGVLKGSRQPTAALQFARYVTARDRGGVALKKVGYHTMPLADVWQERPEILLSAGAMLMPAIHDVIEQFQKREGAHITVTQAGCGILVSQMQTIKAAGTDDKFPDAYFACDTSFMHQVQKWFGPPINIARNELVLIRRQGDARTRDVKGLEALARTDLRVGLCDPDKSALGFLVDRLLVELGLHDQVYANGWKAHIVHVDAAHLLVTQMRAGSLDLAVVYRSNARATPEALQKEIEIVELHLPQAVATQPFAIAQSSKHYYLTLRLRDALTSAASAREFERLGFQWQGGSK
jgi:molybdenum ABC transporter molybdate-binding protein